MTAPFRQDRACCLSAYTALSRQTATLFASTGRSCALFSSEWHNRPASRRASPPARDTGLSLVGGRLDYRHAPSRAALRESGRDSPSAVSPVLTAAVACPWVDGYGIPVEGRAFVARQCQGIAVVRIFPPMSSVAPEVYVRIFYPPPAQR